VKREKRQGGIKRVSQGFRDLGQLLVPGTRRRTRKETGPEKTLGNKWEKPSSKGVNYSWVPHTKGQLHSFYGKRRKKARLVCERKIQKFSKHFVGPAGTAQNRQEVRGQKTRKWNQVVGLKLGNH